jgi:WD40 repeat protein
VRTFLEYDSIYCIDISGDSTLLAVASYGEVRIWTLNTGKLVADPFDIGGLIPQTLRFSKDSRKLAVSSYDLEELHLEVWDVQTQKLDVQKSTRDNVDSNYPIFWTTKDKSIVTAFNSKNDVYEFAASTLKTVGAPFKHTLFLCGLALSSDSVFLASSSYNRTIKLWAFESRQLHASFDVEFCFTLLLSPDSRQLACTCTDNTKIHICDIPPSILTSIKSVCIPAYIHHLYANILTDLQI